MQTGADGSSESIGVIPNKLKGNCEALLLVLSALDGDTGEADLTSAAARPTTCPEKEVPLLSHTPVDRDTPAGNLPFLTYI